MTVDALTRWNKEKPYIGEDVRFIRLLLLDVFKATKLITSTLDSLDPEKIRFVRGLFLLLFGMKKKSSDFNSYSHRYFRQQSKRRHGTCEPLQCIG